MGSLPPSDQRLRLAQSLGYEIHSGSKHWHAIHSVTGQLVLIPRSKRDTRQGERNLLAALRRCARVHPPALSGPPS